MAATNKASKSRLVSGRFEIESKLGSGGFGVVYRAYDSELGARVALKTLHETNARTLYRFKREFRALADIAHPNLITLYELISEGDLWYFTMELVDGMDFLRWCARPPQAASNLEVSPAAATLEIDAALVEDTSEFAAVEPLETGEHLEPELGRCAADPERVRVALAQLTRALMALHRFGKLHRDIKPSNVLVTPKGRVVLLDFGLVTDLAEQSLVQKLERENSSHQINFAGTPRYMSPEQAMGGELDAATDWYAVGVMLYETLTGEAPVQGDTPLKLLLRKQIVDPRAPGQLVGDVPDDLDELCVALLNRDASQRPGGEDILERLGVLGEMHSLRSSVSWSSRSSTHSGSGLHHPSFVGRADKLEALRRALIGSIHTGTLAVANVQGPSGMGKSTLVRRFLQSLRGDSFQPVILEGRCYQNESVPYKALDSLVDDLSTYLHKFSQAEVTTWLGGDVHALTQLFPVLERAPTVRAAVEKIGPTLHDSRTQRDRAFSALRKLLSGLADKHPLVLFIDDVQWGDEDSAVLLKELLTPPNPPSLFLVTTWRSEDAETSPFLTTFLPALEAVSSAGGARGEQVMRRLDIQLGELDVDEARELASRLLEDEVSIPAERVEAIARESHGHPFFIDELVRHSRAYDTGPDSDLTSLGDVIFRRIETLSAPARRLLEVLSVAAQPIDRRIARAVARLDEDEQAVLATLRGEHLLRVKSARDYDWLEPYHARIGETIVERLEEEALVDYHGELARSLEAAGHFDPETVAHHFLGAGNVDKAGHYSLVAAKRASAALAFERAARLYEQALELRPWPNKRVDLLDQLGTTYGYLGRGTLAARAYLEAAEACGSPAGQGVDQGEATPSLDFRIRAAEQLLRGGQFDEGMRLIEEALRMTGFEPPSSTIKMLGSIVWKRFRVKRRGFEVEPRPRDEIAQATLTRIEALWTAAKMLGVIDPVAGAFYHYHALWEALESGSPSHLALCLCQQAAQESSSSTAPQLAEDLIDQAESLLDVCETPDYVRGYVHFQRGFFHYTSGHFEQGRRQIRQAGDILEERCTGVVWEITTFRFLEFFPTYWLGDYTAFAEQMPRMLEHAEARNDRFHMVALRSWMYPAHLRADAPDKARADLEHALRDWTRQGYHIQHFWYLQGMVETALYEGNGLTAWSLIEEHRRPLRRSMLLTSKIIEMIVWNLSARAAVAALRRTSGFLARWKLTRHARRAIENLRTSEADWVDALADLSAAELLVQDGRFDRACALLAAAEQSLEANDMALHARAARRRRGELKALQQGDPSGTEFIRSAELWMTENGIDNPAAMTAMLTGAPRHPDRPKLPMS